MGWNGFAVADEVYVVDSLGSYDCHIVWDHIGGPCEVIAKQTLSFLDGRCFPFFLDKMLPYINVDIFLNLTFASCFWTWIK